MAKKKTHKSASKKTTQQPPTNRNADSKKILSEVAITYFGVLVAIFALVMLSPLWTWLQEFMLGIATVLFVLVARWRVNRDRDPDRYHLESKHLVRDTIIGLVASLVVFPFFAAGFWLWNTQVLGAEFDFSISHYHQWPTELQGRIPSQDIQEPGIYLGESRDNLYITVKAEPKRFNSKFIVESSDEFAPQVAGIVARDLNGNGTIWEFQLPDEGTDGNVVIEALDDFEIEVLNPDDGTDRFNLPLFLGKNGVVASDARLPFSRHYGWLIMWALTQIFLVALGEEIFYRGYLQRRVRDYLELRAPTAEAPLTDAPRGPPKTFLNVDFTTWMAIIITSLLFAFGHLVIPIGGTILPSRLAVFFPSLIFGLLKVRTDGCVASIVFHGLCNMMLIILAVHFF